MYVYVCRRIGNDSSHHRPRAAAGALSEALAQGLVEGDLSGSAAADAERRKAATRKAYSS